MRELLAALVLFLMVSPVFLVALLAPRRHNQQHSLL